MEFTKFEIDLLRIALYHDIQSIREETKGMMPLGVVQAADQAIAARQDLIAKLEAK